MSHVLQAQKGVIGSEGLHVFITSGVTTVPFLYPGCIVELDMLDPLTKQSNHFTTLMITDITHTVDTLGKYHGYFEAVDAQTGFIPRIDYTSPLAEQQIATVVSNADPQGKGRVQVQFDWQYRDQSTEWIRVMTPDAGSSDKVGSNRGFVAIPEEGDQVMISFVGNHPDRPFVMETLLYMGCKYADNADNADNADEIVVKVFEYIRTLNVERARIKGAMGYWRNTSSLHAYGMFKFRGVRYLLKVGEARCGEWSDFLMDICKIQSTKLFKGKLFMLIIKPKKDENDSLMYKNCAMLVKEWRIQDPLAPEDIKQRAQDLMNIPLGLFGDHVFVLYNTNYYDPSYGVFSTKGYESSDKLLHDYTNEALSGVLSISNSPNYPLIEAIKYKPLNGVYIDPCDLNTRIPSKCLYKFKTITYNMEKELTGGFYEVF